jgi:hypothetical protein
MASAYRIAYCLSHWISFAAAYRIAYCNIDSNQHTN